MEDSSHELIDQMIAEEQYCYGFDAVNQIANSQNQKSINTIDTSRVNTKDNNKDFVIEKSKEGKTKEHASNESSSYLPSHNQKWSEEEDKALKSAIGLYGFGHWKIISEHVKTRNSLQCKNRARQKFIVLQPQKTILSNNGVNQEISTAKEIPISVSLPKIEEIDLLGVNGTMDLNINHNSESKISHSQEVIPSSLQTIIEETPGTNINQDEPKIPEAESSIQLEIEFDLNQDEISDHERLQNTEWFLGKTAKNPERYMRIRNHIINCWKKNSPFYLTKTAGRRNLADCGDVNAVGRIHAYLESINAINVNCTSPVKRNYIRTYTNRADDGSPRKKKVKKTPGYFWADVDEEDDEFETRDDGTLKGDGKSRPKRVIKKPETFYYENGIDAGHGNDPFTLVPVGYYPNERSAPFTVDVTSDALLVMEFHSHLAYTEIIGLLGGRVVQNEDGSQQLKVEYVFPCRSTSTGIQCEMDPVSEMAAREVFEQKGLHVVGWYHSHPTFEPEPSIRDIENQTSYQDLFRDEVSGVEPFIGVIITPYNSRNMVPDKSQIQFIHISKRWNANKSYRLPFACLQKVTPCKTISNEVTDIFKNLIAEYKTYEHKIDMKLQYGETSRLDKLIDSLKNHLFMEPESNEKFLIDLREMIQSNFNNDTNKDHTLLTQETRQKQMDNIVNSLAI